MVKGYSLHAFLVSCVVLAAIAAIYDLRSHRIPNWLVLAGLVGGVAGHTVMGWRAGGFDLALHAAELSLLGAAVVGVVPLLLWRAGVMGGGDVKIIMAVGAVCHASIGMTMVFAAMSLMACFGIIKLAWDGNLFASMWSGLRALANPFLARKKRMPLTAAAREPMRFGPALALSAFGLVLVHGGF